MGEWVYGIKEISNLPWSLLLTMLALTFLPAPLENVITPYFPPRFSLFKFFLFDKGNQKELKEIPSSVEWLFLRVEKLTLKVISYYFIDSLSMKFDTKQHLENIFERHSL